MFLSVFVFSIIIREAKKSPLELTSQGPFALVLWCAPPDPPVALRLPRHHTAPKKYYTENYYTRCSWTKTLFNIFFISYFLFLAFRIFILFGQVEYTFLGESLCSTFWCLDFFRVFFLSFFSTLLFYFFAHFLLHFFHYLNFCNFRYICISPFFFIIFLFFSFFFVFFRSFFLFFFFFLSLFSGFIYLILFWNLISVYF